MPDYARIRKKTASMTETLKASVWPQGYDATAAAARKPAPVRKPAAAREPKPKATNQMPESAEDFIKNKTVRTPCDFQN